MYLVDLNDDSNLDLVSSIQDGGLRAYLGNGMSGTRIGWWTEVSSGLPSGGKYHQVAVGDVNGDGKLDIGSGTEVWSNSGSMTDSGSYSWKNLELGITEKQPYGIDFGDLDNDGDLDIAGCGWDSGVWAYLLDLDGGSDPGPGPGDVKLKYQVSGTITDPDSGTPIADVSVSVSPGAYSSTTNSQGKYTIEVPNGTYTISFTKDGFKTGSVSLQINGDSVVRDHTLEVGSDTEPPKEAKKDDDGIPFMEIPLLLGALILILALFRYNKRKK
jgi:hypothetical protein